MSQRGSALLNVLLTVTVVMILGLLAMQLVTTDAFSFRGNLDRTRAFQLAEGGIDYGIELLIDKCTLGTEYPISLEGEGDITVTVEAHPTIAHHYYIKSRGERGNAVRSVQLLVEYYPWESAFEHALFIGYSGKEPLVLKNVTIDGETYIGAMDVRLEKVSFKAATHFAGEYVKFSNACDKDNNVMVTRNTNTTIESFSDTHWSHFISSDNKELPFPRISLEHFAGSFYNWGSINEIDFWDLKKTNFFKSDIVIKVDKSDGVFEPEIAIAGLGSVTFVVEKAINNYWGTLIIMAKDNIAGVEKLAPGTDPHGEDPPNKPAPTIYLYSREGTITTEQNIRGLRAVIAEELAFSASQLQYIRTPCFSNELIDEVWRTSVTPVQWIN